MNSQLFPRQAGDSTAEGTGEDWIWSIY